MKRVLVILPGGFEILEAAAFIDTLGWANEEGDHPLETIVAGATKNLRPTFGGLTVQPDHLLTDLTDLTPNEFDAVAIPGGFETHGFFEEAFGEPVVQTLREFAAAGKPIASICVGALPVARSLALTGREATTYHIDTDHRVQQLADMGANVIRQPIVEDQGIITSNGPSTAVDVALRLVERLTTAANAAKVRHLMGFPKATPELRPLRDQDLDTFFAYENEIEAIHMAAFTRKDLSDRASFDAHWQKVRADEATVIRTIIWNGRVAGSILCHGWFGDPEISLWIGQEFWGLGLGTTALASFLADLNDATVEGPLYGRVVADNVGSIRVLERNGFKEHGRATGFANGRGAEADEIIFRLER